MLALGLAFAVTLGGVSIDDGGAQCPSGAQVLEALHALAGEGPPERIELRREPGILRLKLLDASGAALAERTLPGGDCLELARAAAVVLAAWRTDVAMSPPRLQLRAPHHVRSRFEIAASFLASLAGASFAAGAELEAAVGGRRVLGRVAAFGLSLRDVPVGKQPRAHARFTRAGLALGPEVRFHPGRFLLDLHAEATFALLYMDAVGFATTQSATAFDLGLGGGGRAAIRLGPVAPALGISVVGWPIPQSVRVSGPLGGSAAIPRFEVLLTAGIAFGNN